MSRHAPDAESSVADFLAEVRPRLARETLLRLDEPLSKRTTLRVGGPADIYAEPSSEEDLATVVRSALDHALPIMMLGRGSNLLVRDGGIRGVVISLAQPFFSRIEIHGHRVECGAGARMRNVAFAAKKASLTGLEFLEGIPGTIGGGLRMNAGAMGSSMLVVAESLRYMTKQGEIMERPVSEIPVEYRCCPILLENIALAAVLKGEEAPREVVDRRMSECSEKRWSSQPAAPSAGCIFKNPVTIPTGRLVQELGLKGTRRGGAVISEVHGNFIVNEGKASARDILELIELVKEKALSSRQIELHTEVQIVGEEIE